MTNPKCKLVVVPEGCVVVPEEPITIFSDGPWTFEETGQRYGGSELDEAAYSAYRNFPQPDTPPVLRWEEGMLWAGNEVLAWVMSTIDETWCWKTRDIGWRCEGDEQEARHAAEKALGFPDGLIVEVV